MSTAVERYSPDYVEKAADEWMASSFLPTSYLDKAGKPMVAEVRLACAYLAALDCDPRTFFKDTYVVHRRVELMAEPQRVLLRRHGYDFEVVEDTDTRCTVRGRRPGGQWIEYTVSFEEAKRAGWVDRNTNYATVPRAMLRARASTGWISLNAPEVKYDLAQVDRRFGFSVSPAEENQAPVTIPRAEIESWGVLDDEDLDDIIERLKALPADQVEWFRRRWKDDFGCPNLHRRRWLTKAHGALAFYMLAEAEKAADLAAQLGEIPAEAHDDDQTPEALEHDTTRYDPDDDDPSRPF